MLPAARESRRQLLSHLRTEVGREALEGCNALVLTPLGEVVEQTWMKMLGLGASVDRPISVELEDAGVPRWLREKAQQDAATLHKNTLDYIDSMLADLDRNMSNMINSVRMERSEIKNHR